MKQKSKTKLVSVLLAVLMVLGLMPGGMTAKAADTTAVATEAELLSAIAASGHITLVENIELTAAVAINGKTITIDGAGHSVSLKSEGAYRHFMLNNSAELTLQNITLQGNPNYMGGGVYAINDSMVSLTDCIIADCKAESGGGVYVYNNSEAVLSGSSIVNCTATSGGGVYAYSSSVDIKDGSEITDCAAVHGGGAFCRAESGLSLTNSSISGCAASTRGGGANLANSRLTAYGSAVEGCTAEISGGGMYCNNGSEVKLLDGSSITGCTAVMHGGGAYRTENTTFSSDSGTCYDSNKAATAYVCGDVSGIEYVCTSIIGSFDTAGKPVYDGPVNDFDIYWDTEMGYIQSVYDITFVDGCCEDRPSVLECMYENINYILPDAAELGFDHDGMAFSGWNTELSAAGVDVEAGTAVLIDHDYTFYGVWQAEAVDYTLRFETNGGTSIEAVSGASGTVIDLSAYQPLKEGFTFTGWYREEGLTNKITSVTMTDNITVYAGWEKAEEPQGVIHKPYIAGYIDGTFCPDGNTTRAETAQMLYNITGTMSADTNTFSDVPAGAWYYDAVTYLTDSGVSAGYPDGSFRPGNAITRAEFVTLAAKYAELPASDGSSFTDVPSDHWAYGYVSAAYEAGWVSGYPDGSFAPEHSITRAEAVVILNAMLGRAIDVTVTAEHTMPFIDIPTDLWSYGQILEAAVEHEHKAVIS